MLKGIVDEIIYTGFQSKYFVKISDSLYSGFQQHRKFFTDEIEAKWKDEVYIWWNCKDSYIVEVEKG